MVNQKMKRWFQCTIENRFNLKEKVKSKLSSATWVERLNPTKTFWKINSPAQKSLSHLRDLI